MIKIYGSQLKKIIFFRNINQIFMIHPINTTSKCKQQKSESEVYTLRFLYENVVIYIRIRVYCVLYKDQVRDLALYYLLAGFAASL